MERGPPEAAGHSRTTPRISLSLRFLLVQPREITSDSFPLVPSWRYNSNYHYECVSRGGNLPDSRRQISLPFHLLGVPETSWPPGDAAIAAHPPCGPRAR